MICSISGESARKPVLSKISGRIFENDLLRKYVDEYQLDPIVHTAMTHEDIIEIHGQEKDINTIRNPKETSIPQLMKMFQSEWDAMMLESFKLKEQYIAVRQELSQALYQHDGACRVIARLTKERDAARLAFANLVKSKNDSMEIDTTEEAKAEEEEAEENVLPEEIVEIIDAASVDLSKARRKRKVDGLKTTEEIQSFVPSSSLTKIHSASTPDMTSISINPRDNNKMATAGSDKMILIHDKSGGKPLATLKGHTKSVNTVSWHSTKDMILSGSADNSVKVWTSENEGDSWKASSTLKTHKSDVTSVSIHATGSYYLSASLDGSWSFNDIESNKSIHQQSSSDSPRKKNANSVSGYSSATFHPDGLICATGSEDGIVKVWDIKTSKVAFECPESCRGAVSGLAFSENGYYFATAGKEDSSVAIWDLRKLAKVTDITIGKESVIRSVKFDYSGNYLAVAGSDIRIFLAKQWTELNVFNNSHDGEVSDVVFGDNQANYIASIGATDRVVQFYESP